MHTFLAPIGAQGVTISVCPAQSVQEQSIFIFLAQIFKLSSCELQAVSQQSVSSESAANQQSFNSHSVSRHTVGALNTSSC